VSTAIALFTRDLRVHDNPMLTAAVNAADHVVPLFVHDDAIYATGFAAAPRVTFLTDALADLDAALHTIGGCLIVRRGHLVEQVCRLAEQINAAEVHLCADVSGYAQRRQVHLADALATQRTALHLHDEVITIIAPGRITPTGPGKDHFAMFTPYLRRWAVTPRRPLEAVPHRLRLPSTLDNDEHPTTTTPRSQRWLGGETEGRRRAHQWLTGEITNYHEQHDDLAADDTSGLSPYLHFGCLSPLELVTRATAEDTGEGTKAFIRQLVWRDFHHQVLAARPEAARKDYRPRGDRWYDDQQALQAWQAGHTGIPIVDAGMRQLRAENWMHNRARLITSSFLAKTLYLDWRAGAQHFFDHLVDGDIANNCLNWQWIAGTGNDTRPNRILNPLRQAERYDPRGDYVRRWIPELADLDTPDIHQPWRLGDANLRHRDYPPPIINLDHARIRFLQTRKP
jgi:deoxyribodipyrimidine photo-lyase